MFFCEGLTLRSSAVQRSRVRCVSISSCLLDIDSRFGSNLRHWDRLLVSDERRGNDGGIATVFKGMVKS